MIRKVRISKTAESKLEKLFEYLIENWSQKVKSDFVKKLDKTIKIIKTHPESFPESHKHKGLRKCVVTKQTTLFYRFNSKEIIVVTVFDSRQNPEKLKSQLKK